MTKRKPQNFCRNSVIVFLITCLTICGFSVLYIVYRYPSVRDNPYCNRDNELFGILKNNPELFENATNDVISLPDTYGMNYTAYNERWTTEDNSPIFFVPVSLDWPATMIGLSGLFYTPTGKLPIYGATITTQLSEKIYCYEKG
jgi:hypothetical protein